MNILRKDLLIILLLTTLSPLFFYKLGQSSLVSFDEAWYGSIAKNILKSGNTINLMWNGQSYNDHPPIGFLFIAASLNLFGDSAFSVRLPAAILGLLSLSLIYLLGKELFGRLVGFASALALVSSYWFLFRARSGNLDVPLTAFFLLTLLLALYSVKNKRFLPLFSMSLAVLLLMKTLVPFTIFPTLLLIFWKRKDKDYIKALVFPVLIFISWFIFQLTQDPFFFNHYFLIGLAGVNIQNDYGNNLRLIKEYLHAGVGKWFWPGTLAIFISPFLREKRFIILSSFFVIFFLPFIFSQKGHIWHLIPLYPVMILSFFGLSYILMKRYIRNQVIIGIVILGIAFYFSSLQIRSIWYQFIEIPRYISDEEILSREAKKYPFDYYVDSESIAAAAFYSEKIVTRLRAKDLIPLFNTEKKFTLFTYQWRLDGADISKSSYQIIKKDRDKILVIRR